MSFLKRASFMILMLPSTYSVAMAQQAVPTPTPATGTTAGGDVGIADIVVTATKRSENVQNVPVSITALSGANLVAKGVNTVLSLPEVTPGMNAASEGGFFIPYIRGIGNGAGSLGNEAPVATYLDGSYISNQISAAAYEFLDIARIEVLKGPQGTLFGRNATGGAISIVSKAPSDQLEGQLESGYGNHNDWKVNGYLTGPIANGINGSIAYIHHQNDGDIHNINPLNGLNDKDFGINLNSVRAKISADVSSTLKLLLTGDFTDSNDYGASAWQPLSPASTTAEGLVALGLLPPQLGIVSRTPNEYAGSFRPLAASKSWGINFTANLDANIFDAKYIAAYRYYKTRQLTDIDDVDANIFGYDANGTTRSLQQELQLTSKNSGPFKWIAGAFYFRDHTQYTDLGEYVGVPLDVTPVGLADIYAASPTSSLTHGRDGRVSESWAVFGEASYNFAPETKLTIGVRYNHEKISLDAAQIDEQLPNSAVNPTGFTSEQIYSHPTGVEKTFSEPTWSAILDHKLNVNTLLYASYKRGFKSGVFSISDPTDTHATDPEKIDAFELGFKTKLFDNKVRLNGAAFYYNYSNLQVNVTLPNGANTTENAAKAKIKGAELDLEWRPVQALTIAASGSYLNARYSSYPNATVYLPAPLGLGFNTALADLSHTPMPYSPAFTSSLGPSYHLGLNGHGSLDFNTNWYHSAKYEAADITKFVINAYNKINASITWTSESGAFYARVWGDNLTNAYVPACLSNNALGYSCRYQPDRTYGATLGIRIGRQ